MTKLILHINFLKKEVSMCPIRNEREAFIFGQQQMSVVPPQFHQAFLKGARSKEKRTGGPKILDPEIEGAYKRLLSVYKTNSAVAKALGMSVTNLYNYINGNLFAGPRTKKRFFAALANLGEEPAGPEGCL